MDAYPKFRTLNGLNQGLEVRAVLHFIIIKGLQCIGGKNSKDITNESVDTNTPACAMLWYVWRQANDVMNCIEDCININTKTIDEIQKLENSNSTTI
jgi:hypothetical protein